MEEEIWKDVVGWEGFYEVSSLGRVKSLPRLIPKGTGQWETKERILKSPLSGNGYPTVHLCKNGTHKAARVHQLIAIAFLNHAIDGNKVVIDHINGIKTVNRIWNLRIVTHRFNNSVGERKNKDKFTSHHIGVCWEKSRKKWHSQIRVGSELKYLGRFINEIDASNAYQSALKKFLNQ